MEKPRHQHWVRYGLLAAGLVATAPAALAQGTPPAPVVGAAQPLQQRVQLWDEYTGRFVPFEQVEVRARVSGYVDKIHFRDGQIVKRGDLLFTIDPRPFQLALEAARAEVARAQAQVQLAENEVERAEGLIRNQTITARDVDQRRSTLAVQRAVLLAAEANAKTAELNVEWTEVRAPIDGRISDKRIDVGNLIAGGQAGATLLTTIVRLDPIHFEFDASEADFLRYSRLSASGDRPSGRNTANPVQVRLSDEKDWKRTGKMDFVDNRINARSGTIRGRAVFDNADQLLTPGTFGRMRLWGGDADVLLVPDAAIVSDQARKVVLVVGPENKVVPKVVTLGPIANGLRVIREGLTAQDRVIITGIANPMVRPGAVVNPQPAEIKAQN
ncbi:MAG: efflux RND transporter periplasmic adaptor subunit [Hyphomicrobiales bacterium]|uniref:efflux RND transporter periplasmic adaptor subunit n=1 Tax=Rhabdaerophilum calidifontis TaxID=2604328 RepID=UPI00123B845A|nr:efflux RND transporter periplasmic adaptor subunit [Rhabdaerophilum calidifontis]MCA1998996.1 efflux RND transporter periplasmic adaptor subunit [Hyphomicrobiales bacterium]